MDIYKLGGGEAMIEREGVWMPLSEGYCKEYDLHVKEDMLFGKIGENFTKDLFEGNTKMEIKTERDIWKTTGNIAIEIGIKVNHQAFLQQNHRFGYIYCLIKGS